MNNPQEQPYQISVHDLKRMDETAWNLLHAKTDHVVKGVIRKLIKEFGIKNNFNEYEDIVQGWYIEFIKILNKGKITHSPERALVSKKFIRNYMLKMRDLEKRERVRGDLYDPQGLPEDIESDYKEVDRVALLEFHKDFSKALLMWQNELDFFKDTERWTQVENPFLQLASLELHMLKWEVPADRAKVLQMNSTNQYFRVIERSFQNIKKFLPAAYLDAQFNEIEPGTILKPWEDSQASCAPFLFNPDWISDPLIPDSIQAHRGVHLRVFQCETCSYWESKRVSEVKVSEEIYGLTQQSLRTLRDTRG